MSSFRKRLARRAVVGALGMLIAMAAGPSAVFANNCPYPSHINGYNIVCVFYTQTSGSCWETVTTDGCIEHNTYIFWGNWWMQTT